MSSERYGGEDPIALENNRVLLHPDDVTVVRNEDTGQIIGYLVPRDVLVGGVRR